MGDLQMTIFPEPQISELAGATFKINAPRIILGDDATELERHAASLVEKTAGMGDGVRIVLGTPKSNAACRPRFSVASPVSPTPTRAT